MQVSLSMGLYCVNIAKKFNNPNIIKLKPQQTSHQIFQATNPVVYICEFCRWASFQQQQVPGRSRLAKGFHRKLQPFDGNKNTTPPRPLPQVRLVLPRAFCMWIREDEDSATLFSRVGRENRIKTPGVASNMCLGC
jgi:hypothetical protein